MNEPISKDVPGKTRRTIYVDLDGSLVYGDLLHESIFVLLGQRPFWLLRLLMWLLKGRVFFKEQIARHVDIDLETMPFRLDLLEYLKNEQRAGARLVLATATPRRYAEEIADHLGIFDGVMSTGDGINLKAGNKLARIRQEAGDRGFEYVGNSTADLPIWQAASRAVLCGVSRA